MGSGRSQVRADGAMTKMIFDRMKNLIGGVVNKGVSKMETPEILMEQAQMELETNVKKLKEALTGSMANEKMLEKQLQKNADELKTWEKRATVAVEQDNDKLATECLQKKRETSELKLSLDTQLESQKQTTASLKSSFSDMEEKLREFRNKKSAMTARAQASDAVAKANDLMSGTTGSSMDKWEEKIRQKEYKSDPLGTSSDDQKFKQLDQDSHLNDELAALKAKVGSTPKLVEDKSSKTVVDENVPMVVEVLDPKKDADDEKK